MGTATTVEEARQLEQAGVDAVIAQGSEAGAHRGTFAVPAEEALVGTVALVPQVVDAVEGSSDCFRRHHGRTRPGGGIGAGRQRGADGNGISGLQRGGDERCLS